MDNQNEESDFEIKSLQEDIKTFFEIDKQLEYKAYINITLSTFLLTVFLGSFGIADIADVRTKNMVIGFSVIVSITFFIIVSLLIYILQDLNSYSNYLNYSDSLKKDPLIEIRGKYINLSKIYTQKRKFLGYMNFFLGGEFGEIVVYSILLLAYFKLK
jgi:hypothetical protein